jgi:hypothetical protein
MDRSELVQALQELDSRLEASCDIIVIGGAAMILHFGAQRATRDIDILLLRGDIGELRRAVKTVAKLHSLPDDWLSDAAKGFADILPPDFYHRLTVLPLPLQRLHVYVLGRPEQAAMKIVALREQDLEDLEVLLPSMDDTDKSILVAIIHHIARYRPDWAQRIEYFLQEQGWQIQ